MQLEDSNNNLCLYCEGKEHLLRYCLGRLGNSWIHRKAILSEDSSSERLTLSATVVSPSGVRSAVSAFVVSGCAGSFIHSSLVAKHHLRVTHLRKPLCISSISGEGLARYTQYCTLPLIVQNRAMHR